MSRLRAALAAVLALLVALPLALPATAQEVEDDPDVRLVVTSLTTVIGPGTLAGQPAGDSATDDAAAEAAQEAAREAARAAEQVDVRVLVENRGDEPVADLRLSVEVFDAVSFRSTARTALDLGDPRSRLRLLYTQDLEVREGEAIAPGDVAGLRFSASAAELGIADPPGAGVVFPLRLSVGQAFEPLDQVTTSVVYLHDAVEQPLTTTLAWPIDDQPWRRSEGVYPAGIDDAVRPGGRLDRIVRAAERRDGLVLTYLAGAHLLEDLSDRADGFRQQTPDGIVEVGDDDPAAQRAAIFGTRLRSALATSPTPPVAAAYADVDIAGLVRAPAPLDDEAASAVSRGKLRLARATDRAPATGTYWANTQLDRPTLDVLADQAATERVLLPFGQLGYTGDLDTFPDDVPGPLVQLTSASGRRLLGLVPDPYVDRTLREPDVEHGPIVAAQRFLAETAVLWTERPLTPRALVVLPPPDWDPAGRFASALLDAVAAAPWIGLSAPEELDALLDDSTGTVQLPASGGQLGDDFTGHLLSTRRQLAAVQQAVPDDGGLIAGRSVDELELQLLRAPSAWFAGDGTGAALVDDVSAVVAEAYGKISVAEGARITLTSDTGQIPVTIQRPQGGPLDVVIEVDCPCANLQWPEGTTKRVTLNGTGAQTHSFAVEARSTGSFGVNVTVTDPAGVRQLAAGRIAIRSTAISGPALLGTGVVIALLLLVGLLRRQPDRPNLELVGS